MTKTKTKHIRPTMADTIEAITLTIGVACSLLYAIAWVF